jgi:hypothetical protein
VPDGESTHLAEYGLDLLGHRGAVLELDGSKVPIRETDGQLSDPDVPRAGMMCLSRRSR